MNTGRMAILLGTLSVLPGGIQAAGPAHAAEESLEAAPAVENGQEGQEAATTLQDLLEDPEEGAAGAGTEESSGQMGEDGRTGEENSEEPAASYGTREKLVLYQIPERFESPKRYTLSLAGGLTRFDELDGLMASSNGVEEYFTYAPTFRFQIGRQFADQVQLQLELGYARYRGFALGEDGSVSGDVIEAKAYPGSLSLSYRFDYFAEQAIVPYFGGGLSGVVGTFTDLEDSLGSTSSDTTDTTSEDTGDTVSTEDTTGSSETTTVSLGAVGTRVGAYLGFGLEFLLDVFEPERASDLELSSGVNDTYLVLDVRYYWLDRYFENSSLLRDQDHVPYNGLQVTAGLKFDF